MLDLSAYINTWSKIDHYQGRPWGKASKPAISGNPPETSTDEQPPIPLPLLPSWFYIFFIVMLVQKHVVEE